MKLIEKQIIAKVARSEGYDYFHINATAIQYFNLFGNKIKISEKELSIPFYFQSLDIAKDFCEVFPDSIKPNILQQYFSNFASDILRRYHTYKLKCGVYYIYVVWKNEYINHEHRLLEDIYDTTSKNNIVGWFGVNMKFYQNSKEIYRDSFDKLSDVINYLNRNTKYSKNAEEYTYQLIQK